MADCVNADPAHCQGIATVLVACEPGHQNPTDTVDILLCEHHRQCTVCRKPARDRACAVLTSPHTAAVVACWSPDDSECSFLCNECLHVVPARMRNTLWRGGGACCVRCVGECVTCTEHVLAWKMRKCTNEENGTITGVCESCAANEDAERRAAIGDDDDCGDDV